MITFYDLSDRLAAHHFLLEFLRCSFNHWVCPATFYGNVNIWFNSYGLCLVSYIFDHVYHSWSIVRFAEKLKSFEIQFLFKEWTSKEFIVNSSSNFTSRDFGMMVCYGIVLITSLCPASVWVGGQVSMFLAILTKHAFSFCYPMFSLSTGQKQLFMGYSLISDVIKRASQQDRCNWPIMYNIFNGKCTQLGKLIFISDIWF